MENFLHAALIFFSAAVILVPIFHRLGLGPILGYLVGGIVVGPFGLKFFDDSESTAHFAELGVVLLLFIIGLEIQPQKLWQMRNRLLGLGLLQVVVTSTIFTLIGSLCGLEFQCAAIVGFGLSLSSTAFALQSLSDRNELTTEFGKGAFAILLMQDLTAIPALAIIPLLFATSGSQNSGGLIYFPLVILGLSISSRFLLRPFFRFIAKTRSREIFTAASLLVVLGVSTVMVKIGLSAALGTFIAGVLLADSEYRHELEANIEPFKSLLMGLFFMSVGMGLSLPLIFDRPLLIVSLSVLYFFMKWAIIYGIGRLSKMDHTSSKLMGLTIAQGGEFAFVIFGMGTDLKILDMETRALLSAMITLSMGMSPLMNIVSDKLMSRRQKTGEREFDQIPEEFPSVIIAGFGRFGQMFGRVLKAQGIPFVAIDHDSDHIELVRKFGNKVYYGDATREDLLVAAGIEKAKYFVLAIDDVENSLETARLVREHFPHIKIFGRARNRGHAFDLMELGVEHIKRETIDSSLNFAGELLVELGYEQGLADRLIERFSQHDQIMLQEQFKVRTDDKMFVSATQQSIAQLEKVLLEDTQKSYITLSPTEET
jgi:monovalent cation:proton antiporter-2 (CPA2) family protein